MDDLELSSDSFISMLFIVKSSIHGEKLMHKSYDKERLVYGEKFLKIAISSIIINIAEVLPYSFVPIGNQAVYDTPSSVFKAKPKGHATQR